MVALVVELAGVVMDVFDPDQATAEGDAEGANGELVEGGLAWVGAPHLDLRLTEVDLEMVELGGGGRLADAPQAGEVVRGELIVGGGPHRVDAGQRGIAVAVGSGQRKAEAV